MSLIFEALQTLESERAGVDSSALLDAEEFLWCAEHKVASKRETALWQPNDEGRQPPAITGTASARCRVALARRG